MLGFHFYPDSKTLPFVSAVSSLGVLAVLYFRTEQLGEMGWEMITFIQALGMFQKCLGISPCRSGHVPAEVAHSYSFLGIFI